MTRYGMPNRSRFFSHSTLAITLALGVVAGAAALPEPAMAKPKAPKAPKVSFSQGFAAVAGPAQTAIVEAGKRADVTAAKAQLDGALRSGNEQQISVARSAMNAALGNEISMIDQVFAAIENEDDRLLAGQLAVNLGSIALDSGLQRRGVKAMIASGKSDPAQVPRFNSIVGQLAYQAGDYGEAAQYLQTAVDAGFTENNSEAILAESYISNNNAAKGLSILRNGIIRSKSAGSLAPEAWYRRGLLSAYKAGLWNETSDFGSMLVADHPSSQNVGIAATILREMGGFASQETLDLMRLMGRTNSYAEERDYVEYVQAADPRRLPGEVLQVIESGVSSGKLKAGDTFVIDAKRQASERVTSDRASLDGYARDAKSARANEATVTGAADALLSYGRNAEAVELYQIALSKPGVETDRVMTRIGIAQFDQGKYAEAQQTFAKVGGKRAAIAKLWSAYAASKLASKPTVSAPALPAAAPQS